MNKGMVANKNKVWIFIGIMVILSPLFAIAADMVGYSEPLENAAEHLGAEEDQDYTGLLPDYSVPGLGMVSGTLISGIVGTLITLGVVLVIGKAVGKKHGDS